jgi:hypothetical protein
MKGAIDLDDANPQMPPPPWRHGHTAATRLESELGNTPAPSPAMPRAATIDWPPQRPTAQWPRRPRAPEIIPERRKVVRPRTKRSLLQMSFYLWLAAVVSYGVVEMTLAYTQRPVPAVAEASLGSAISSRLAMTTSAARPAAARLLVHDRQAVANEPMPLGIVLHGASGREAVVLTGYAEGTRFSVGEPVGANGWRVPARELANVVAYPPASFAGVKDVVVELRSPENASLDMQVARLEWSAKSGDLRSGDVRSADVRSLPTSAPAWLVEQGHSALPPTAVATLTPAKPAPAETIIPAPIDLAKTAPVDPVKPAPVAPAKPALVDPVKPAPVATAKPAPVDPVKPALVDPVRPATVAAAKPAPIDITALNIAPEHATRLVKRGLDYIKDGNFAAARLMLRPAAEAGDAQAALLLGATYDPVVLADLGVFGLRPDPVTARGWYQRAKDFGATEASGRIDRLAQGK